MPITLIGCSQKCLRMPGGHPSDSICRHLEDNMSAKTLVVNDTVHPIGGLRLLNCGIICSVQVLHIVSSWIFYFQVNVCFWLLYFCITCNVSKA